MHPCRLTAPRVLLALALATTTSIPLSAQSAIAISFTGVPPSDRAALLAVAGLPVTGALTNEQLQAAAQRLGDLGLFTEVRYTTGPQGVIYALTPVAASTLLPLSYSNLVWWTDVELNAEISKRVPLFHGSLPSGGTLNDTVTQTILALLAEKGIADAKTEMLLASPGPSRPVSNYALRVTNPPIRVGMATFVDPPEALKPDIAPLAARLTGVSYDAVNTRIAFADSAVETLRDLNYLDARVESFAPGAPVMADGAVTVPISARVADGPRYTLQSLTISGGDLVHQSDLPKPESFNTGDPWSLGVRKLQASIGTKYSENGYLMAKVDLQPKKDMAAHSVEMAIRVQPGELFHLATLQVNGLNDAQRAAFDKAWPMPVGAVYNMEAAAQKLKTLPALRGLVSSWQMKANQAAHTVDLTLTFKPGSSH